MSSSNLGTIEQVDLREAWQHEATDFTNWLAEEENLQLLSEEIGIYLNLLETEANVGHFNVDIFAEDAVDERKVIIENQLESTDHDHLGKIITYASGLDAEIILWIVKEGREEHRQAVDWLNNHTDEDLNFFLVKVELWKIENSPMAPKFEMISKPNDWAKEVKQSARETQLTETKIKQREFWQQFKKYVSNNSSQFRPTRKAQPQNWYNLSIGVSDVHIALTMNTIKDTLECKLYMYENEDLFQRIQNDSNEVEKSIGKNLNWKLSPDNKSCQIITRREFVLDDESNWGDAFKWMLNTAEDFEKAFGKYM